MTRSKLILLLIGLFALFIMLRSPDVAIRTNHLLGALTGISLALIPAVRQFLLRKMDQWNNASPRAQRQAFLLIFFAMIGVLYHTAWFEDREFNPLWHDTLSYLQQMQIVATGRLWMPEHPMADFFETYHFLVKPVYTSIYFPGTAILFAPQVWLHLPPWQGPLIAMGLCAGLLYLILSDLLDNTSALIGVLLLIGIRPFRQFSIAVMSSGAMLLLVLAITWAFLRWRRSRSIGWACAIGAFAGFGAITRPLDAFCVALPIGLTMLWEFRDLARSKWAATIIPGVLCALPFLVLQLYYNQGVTGDAWTSPYRYYMDRHAPGINPGFHEYDSSKAPQTKLLQKQIYHQEFNVPAIQQHTWGNIATHWVKSRLPLAALSVLVSPLLITFLFLGFQNLRRPDWLAIVAPIPLFIAAYTFYPFILSHYWLAVLPGFIFLMLRARQVIIEMLPERRQFIATASALVLVGMSFSTLPQFGSGALDDFTRRGSLMTANFEQVPAAVETPAVILYRFHPEADLRFEPVYNIDTAWPDNAPIIRAHDLGPRNNEILHYYAQRQPGRRFYLYERTPKLYGENVGSEPIGNNLFYLGTAGELARKFPPPKPATSSTR